MIKSLSLWLYKISHIWVMLFTLAVMILFMITVLPGQAASAEQKTGSSSSPDTAFFYSATDLLQLAEEYGPEGRQAYIRSRWTFDLLFPLVYVSFLAAGISWFFRTMNALSSRFLTLNTLPVAAGIFDLLENSGTSLVMGFYPRQVPVVAWITPILSAIKWLLVGTSFLLYFLVAGAALYLWIRSRKKN
jgi:hypothetical protein